MLYLRVKKDFLNKTQTLESLLNFSEIFERGILHNDVLNTFLIPIVYGIASLGLVMVQMNLKKNP